MANWDKQDDSKSWKRSPKVFFGILTLLIAIAVIIAVASIRIPVEAKYSDISLKDEDIVLIFQEHNNTTDTTTLKVELLLTNNGNNDSGQIYMEVYVKNATVRDAPALYKDTSAKYVIKKDTSKRINMTVKMGQGTWDLNFWIWENEKIIEKGNKRVKLVKEDVSSFKDYAPEEDVGRSNVQEVPSKSFLPAFEIPLVAIAFGLIVIFGRKKVKK